ncbi:MAG: preprotein translocase subunit SecE [Candidatus Methylacidiphilales bacterium]|nr:preprotein translocase subunit SecE [Candidatus Methylacidiphilales bacterium]
MEKLNFAGQWWISITIIVLGALALALVLSYRAALAKFWSEVMAELHKCTWPWDPEQTGLRKYKVLIDSTVVVCVVTILLAAYVTGFDFFINKLVAWMVTFEAN